MKQPNYNRENKLLVLISEYEAMSQKGTVGFYEEKVFFDFVNHYRACHKIEKALQVVEHGLMHHSFSADLLHCKAQLLVELNEPAQAIDCLNKALILAPYNKNMRSLLDQLVAIQEQKPTNPLAFLSQFEDTEPFIRKAKINQQFEDVEELYQRLKHKLSVDPTDELALNKILFCIEINQRFQDSIDFHTKLINIAPYSHLAWYNLGQAYMNLKQYENAADALEYSFIAKDNFVTAYKEFSKVCFKLRDYDRALSAFQDLLTKVEPDSDLLAKIGECYEMKEDYSVAYLFYTKALKIDPLFSLAHYRVGECFAKQKQWEKAIESYQFAIQINNRKEKYQAALGEAYFQIGKNKKAFKAFERAADICPDVSTYWMQLITFLMSIEDFDQAWEKIEEAELYIFDAAELAYVKVACLYLMDDQHSAKTALMDTLNRYYPKHELLFEYAPEIEEDMGIIALINIFNLN